MPFKQFGEIGSKLVSAVDNEVLNIIKNFSKRITDEKVMISGMAYIKDGKIVIKVEVIFYLKKLQREKGKY